MNNVYCFYVDNGSIDLKCAAAIVNRKHNGARIFKLKSKDEFPFSILYDGTSIVYLLGFSLSIDSMITLSNKVKLTWIDNNYENIKISSSSGLCPEYSRLNPSASISLMLWELLFPYEDIPPGISQINKYVINNYNDSSSHAYDLSLKALENSTGELDVKHSGWTNILHPNSDISHFELLKEGKNILSYKQALFTEYVNSTACIVQFYGYKALAINIFSDDVYIFSLIKDQYEHDFKMCFSWVKDNWLIRMFSDKVDVSSIAASYNGSGTPNRAEFIINQLPFNL